MHVKMFVGKRSSQLSADSRMLSLAGGGDLHVKVFVWNRDRRAASSPPTPLGCHCPVGATCRQGVFGKAGGLPFHHRRQFCELPAGKRSAAETVTVSEECLPIDGSHTLRAASYANTGLFSFGRLLTAGVMAVGQQQSEWLFPCSAHYCLSPVLAWDVSRHTDTSDREREGGRGG